MLIRTYFVVSGKAKAFDIFIGNPKKLCFFLLDGFPFCFVLFWFYIRNSRRRNVFSWLIKKPKFYSLHANIEKPSGLRITFSDRTGHDYGYNRTTEIARNHVHLMITMKRALGGPVEWKIWLFLHQHFFAHKVSTRFVLPVKRSKSEWSSHHSFVWESSV